MGCYEKIMNWDKINWQHIFRAPFLCNHAIMYDDVMLLKERIKFVSGWNSIRKWCQTQAESWIRIFGCGGEVSEADGWDVVVLEVTQCFFGGHIAC